MTRPAALPGLGTGPEQPNGAVSQRGYAGIMADGGRGAGRRFRDIGPGMHGAGPGGRVRERA